jgi:hypothetical protein
VASLSNQADLSLKNSDLFRISIFGFRIFFILWFFQMKLNLKQNCGHLSNKQRAVIEDIFKNAISEHEVLEKYKIRPCRYRNWLKNGLFTQEIDNRIEAAVRQSKLAMARWLPLVAERLAQLTISEKDETARKACLDIISLHTHENEQKTARNAQAAQPNEIKLLPPEIASKLLAALAEKDTTAASGSERSLKIK